MLVIMQFLFFSVDSVNYFWQKMIYHYSLVIKINKIAKKLHCQFDHSSLKKLNCCSLLTYMIEINNVEEQSEISYKYKKHNLKPVVGFSLSRSVNDVVALDLKTMEVSMML